MLARCPNCGKAYHVTDDEKFCSPQCERKASVQLEIDHWNDRNPIGTPVLVKKYDGTIAHTKTRSQAIMLEAIAPAVLVDGSVGYYHLKRVRRENP